MLPMRRASATSRPDAPAAGWARRPFAAILGCADSRVAPELAFDQGPGDLFAVRVARNFVTDEGLASPEFGAVYDLDTGKVNFV